ncbi:protein HIDE1 isoform X2 [Pogona vitticeps]
MASSLFPAPLILLGTVSDCPIEGESVDIACYAPGAFMDAWFSLFKDDQTRAVQTLPAAETHHHVIFILKNITTRDKGQYRCQYGLFNRSEFKLSQFSQILQIPVGECAFTTFSPKDLPRSKEPTFTTSSPTDLPRSKDSISWVVPTAVSVAGVLLLVLILVVAMVATGRLKERRQKKREMDSCWTETSYPTTEISFDNYMFTVSMKPDKEAVENQSTWISLAMAARLSSSSSVEKPAFCTFRIPE